MKTNDIDQVLLVHTMLKLDSFAFYQLSLNVKDKFFSETLEDYMKGMNEIADKLAKKYGPAMQERLGSQSLQEFTNKKLETFVDLRLKDFGLKGMKYAVSNNSRQ